jgi:glycosyltransferase involved in cell wall biosynthesis
MEAWLAGTPVLVHGRCAVTAHHVAHADGGLMFEDFYEFAEALDLLIGNAAQRDRLGAQGRAYVEAEYGWPAVTLRLRDTLERLVA